MRASASAHRTDALGARSLLAVPLRAPAQRTLMSVLVRLPGLVDECGFSQQAKAPDRITVVEVAGRSGVRLRTMPATRASRQRRRGARGICLSPEATGCFQGQEQCGRTRCSFPPTIVRSRRRRPMALGVCLPSSHRLAGAGEFPGRGSGHAGQAALSDFRGPVVSSGAPGSPPGAGRSPDRQEPLV